MTEETEAAQAPAAVEAVPAEPVSVDDALSAVWQEHNPEEDETPAPEVDGEAGEGQPLEQPAPVELPTDLPVELKDHWASIPEQTRDAIAASHRELSRKLSAQGREVQGLAPIKDVLNEAIQDMPFLADMHPGEAARQIMDVARIAQRFNVDPVNATLQVIQRYGVADAIRNVLGGASPQNQLTPDMIRQMVQGDLRHEFEWRDVASQVNQFTDGKEHWDAVAGDLPDYIALVAKKNPGASHGEKLSAAYEMAIRANGLGQAPSAIASPEDAMAIDPSKTEAAARATSVNVAGRPTGTPRKLTEDELLRQVYRKSRAS